MKVLYAIQGTGNGHISRAREIIPLLQKKCEIDVLVSGYQTDMELPFEVKYRLHGLSFIFGNQGGIDIRKTYNKANTKKLLAEIRDLPVHEYDFVLNDFEPVSAWACYRNKVPCIALSHQASLLDSSVPKPRNKYDIGKYILRNYAPSSAQIGLHFSRYSGEIYTPVIRKEIREAENTDKGHYTVYLPSYDDKTLIKVLQKVPDVEWRVFSKHNIQPMTVDNIEINPIANDSFIHSLTSCKGVLCGAGFETPAEALFLGKKLMVVPMQNQYEQHYNAAALKSMGVPVLRKLRARKAEKIKEWVSSEFKIEITYPDITQKIINKIFEMYVEGKFPRGKWKNKYTFDLLSAFPEKLKHLISFLFL